MANKDPKKAAAAIARAESLPPETRSEIARAAAQKRWDQVGNVPQSQFSGSLLIGDVQFPCSVLTDGTRILTQSDFMKGMGMYYSGWMAKKQQEQDGTADVPHFLAFENLKPFINKYLGDLQSISVKYRTERGALANGIKAEIIPKICDVWIDADDHLSLGVRQKSIAKNARLIMRALAHVGIIGLVDEVTGYQRFRARDDLQRILAAYVAPELLPWAKKFPDSFYQELHRVRGWKYAPGTSKRTAYIGTLTNMLIYEQLPEGVLSELKQKNPTAPERRWRKHKHHQFLTEEIGHTHLERHIASVVTLLRISDGWEEFLRHFSKAFPSPPEGLFALPPPEFDE